MYVVVAQGGAKEKFHNFKNCYKWQQMFRYE